MRGTACADVIVARRGVEAVYGHGGEDTIYAPAAGVVVDGGGGDDVIRAGPPPRSASTARRTLALEVTDCPDGCYLGGGGDRFDGGPGADVVYGGSGNDILNGGDGDDRLYGGIKDDTIDGGAGNDLLSGGFGGDTVDGGSGDDQVRGDGTADILRDSGGGSDTLSYASAVTPGFPSKSGYPSFSSFRNFPAAAGERGVYLDLSANIADNGLAPTGGGLDSVTGADFENVVGSPFSDYIVGSSHSNVIYGGGGGDVILGGGGDDALSGGADGDHLDGGSGSNTLNGNVGSDHCRNRVRAVGCESANAGGVVLRNATRIGVGAMAPEIPGQTQLYLLGSSSRRLRHRHLHARFAGTGDVQGPSGLGRQI